MDKIVIGGKTYELDFNFGEIVYLKLDKDGMQGMVVGFQWTGEGFSFLVSWANHTRDERNPMELTTTREAY